MATTAKKNDQMVLDGKYPLIPISMIQLAERPEEGEESQKLFFNPRSLDSFDTEAMAMLRESIQQDGLQQPPIVRIFTKSDDKNDIERVELIAGERRYRSISMLYEQNALCYDEDSKSMVPAKKLYAKIPCKALYNISDQQALRIAFKENNEHKSLSTQEEINLVERLSARGMKQEEIGELLGTNVTWVSQTANFRNELPLEAFNKLINGQITRHVAVQILSFNPENREQLFKEACRVEQNERKKALEEIQDELEVAEDLEDIALQEQEEAASEGDVTAAKKAKKTAAAAKKKALEALQQKSKVQETQGVIKQGHIIEGSRKANITPKKVKMLNRAATQEFIVDILDSWLERGKVDDISNEEYPTLVLKTAKAVASGILSGNTDVSNILRAVMVEEGVWPEE
jgi:ParB-like chromosome segregation protein Spo0J